MKARHFDTDKPVILHQQKIGEYYDETYVGKTDGYWLRFQCCDCGLVHDFFIEAQKQSNSLKFQIDRNKRCTAQVRRRRKERIKSGKSTSN